MSIHARDALTNGFLGQLKSLKYAQSAKLPIGILRERKREKKGIKTKIGIREKIKGRIKEREERKV
ncbi:hypothetical protein A3K73_03710 [Candidatus Pacearchaeota archaeon RBG_13_36_9]|nr:MAG: hypothetical protein A3K73_03710 [Candidatus Pacearchaeota archaeon RBG_13_36_9]